MRLGSALTLGRSWEIAEGRDQRLLAVRARAKALATWSVGPGV